MWKTVNLFNINYLVLHFSKYLLKKIIFGCLKYFLACYYKDFIKITIMKKILLITSLLFISFIYSQPKSLQKDLMAQKQQETSSLRMDRNITIEFDENSITEKSEITYDANGKPALYTSYSWDATTQSFIQSYKFEYYFDANGNKTLSKSYDWDTTSQSFVPYYKYESAFDANGNQTLDINYYWDSISQSFVSYYKTEYTYDANGKQILKILNYWNTTTQSFVLNDKSEYSYDASGNVTLKIKYYWDDTTKTFFLGAKYEYAYDANGNQTLSIHYAWKATTQSFVPVYKYLRTYDANGNLTLSISYNWDSTSQSFVPVYKYVRTYSVGLIINHLVYKWDTELGEYKPRFKTEYATILDTNTKLHRMGVTYQYDTNFNVWKELVGEVYKSYEYYTKTTLSTQTIENNLTSLYPNPTSQVLYVSQPELNSLGIQVVDLNGIKMYSGTIQKDVPLDVSTYTPGLYLVTIENKEKNKKNTYKIIKK